MNLLQTSAIPRAAQIYLSVLREQPLGLVNFSNLALFHISNEVSVGLCYESPLLNELGGIDLNSYEILIRLKID